MRLKNSLETELWLWSMQREKFSDLQKRIVSDVPGSKRRTRFMLRRLTMIKFNKERTFFDEIKTMADDYEKRADSSAINSGDDTSNNTDRR